MFVDHSTEQTRFLHHIPPTKTARSRQLKLHLQKTDYRITFTGDCQRGHRSLRMPVNGCGKFLFVVVQKILCKRLWDYHARSSSLLTFFDQTYLTSFPKLRQYPSSYDWAIASQPFPSHALGEDEKSTISRNLFRRIISAPLHNHNQFNSKCGPSWGGTT